MSSPSTNSRSKEVDERSLPGVTGILDQVERRPAVREHTAEFTVQVSILRRQLGDGLGDGGVLVGPDVASSCQDLHAAGVEPGVHPVSVEFDLVQPVSLLGRL
jgi:hypothetical protein